MDVLELPIHARETYVGNIIEVNQFLHNHFPDGFTDDFRIGKHVDFLDDFGENIFDAVGWDRSFPASAFEAQANFFGPEWFAGSVFFDDSYIQFRDSFVSRESFVAVDALTSATNDETLLSGTRIDDFVVVDLAEWTFHVGTIAHMRPKANDWIGELFREVAGFWRSRPQVEARREVADLAF